jgi:hypothetical protein
MRSVSVQVRSEGVLGDDFGKDLVGAPGDVSRFLSSRVVGRGRRGKHACGDAVLLHIRERTFDGPIGLFMSSRLRVIRPVVFLGHLSLDICKKLHNGKLTYAKSPVIIGKHFGM